MELIAIFVVNLILFILSVIGVLNSFFARRWKPFVLLLIAVILTAGGVAIELSQWILPPAPVERPLNFRSWPTPL